MSNRDTLGGHSVFVIFLGLLIVLFIALKLTGNTSWSWWALSPLTFTVVLLSIIAAMAATYSE